MAKMTFTEVIASDCARTKMWETGMGCRLKRAMSTAHRIFIAANRLPLCQTQAIAFATSPLFQALCGETH